MNFKKGFVERTHLVNISLQRATEDAVVKSEANETESLCGGGPFIFMSCILLDLVLLFWLISATANKGLW